MKFLLYLIAVIAYIAATLVMLIFDWFVVCAGIYLVCMLFDWTFSVDTATVIWLAGLLSWIAIYHISRAIKDTLTKKGNNAYINLNEETCVCCGDVIPEGRQVCPKCERELNDIFERKD